MERLSSDSLFGTSGEGDKTWRVICDFPPELFGVSCEEDWELAMALEGQSGHAWTRELIVRALCCRPRSSAVGDHGTR